MRRLHSSEKHVEFVGERIQLLLTCVRQSVEFVYRYQDGLRSIVLRDHHSTALNDHFQHATELIFRVGCSVRGGFELVASSISKSSNRILLRPMQLNSKRGHLLELLSVQRLDQRFHCAQGPGLNR